MRISLKLMSMVLAAVALSGTGSVRASPPAQAPGAREKDHSVILSERASIYLVEIKNETGELLAEIRKETADLGPLPYTPGTSAPNARSSRRSHGAFLSQATSHINAVQQQIAKLQRIRRYLLPWQQQAITEVTSHATEVTASIQATIVHLRENQNRLFVSQYRNHLLTMADRSEDLKQTLDKFLDHEKSPHDASTAATDVGAPG